MRLFFENGEHLFEQNKGVIHSGSLAELTLKLISDWQKEIQSLEIKTSGTTGHFKHIKLSRKHILWSAEHTSEACNLGQYEKEYCCLPINKVGGLMQVLRAQIYDRDLKVVAPSADPMFHLEANHTFTLTSLTPYQIYHIFKNEESREKLACFKAVLVGGGPLPLDLEEKIKSLTNTSKTTFFHTYGMTETASHVALRQIGADSTQPWFQAFHGITIEQDKDACLVIKIAELDLEVQTHDIVEIGAAGFRFIGRKDNIINSGGLKIIPEPLEHVLEIALKNKGYTIPMYFLGVKDEALGQKCVLVVESKFESHKTMLIELLKEHIESYQRPKEIRFVQKIKYTKSNKIIRLG
jgi:o-succinylbenzoate---CoA ligase